MAQHDQVLANGNGLAVRSDMNAALAALFSCSSGGTEPAVKNAGMLWFDTSVGILKLRDNTNANWLSLPVTDLTGGSNTLTLTKTASGQVSRVYGALNATRRWHITLGDSTAESGSNVGSDFGLARYNDAGTVVDVPMFVYRSSGFVVFNTPNLTIQPPTSVSTNLVMNKGASGIACNVFGQTINLNRWLVQLGNGTAESGSGAGSDFAISSYNDAGTVATQVLNITRSTGILRAFVDTPQKPTSGSWAAASDERIKDDIEDYDAGLEEIIGLRPVTYHFKPETGLDTSVVRYGMVAQEAEEVMPELVTQGPYEVGDIKLDDMRIFDPSNIVYALVNAVKTLAARVEELEAKLP